MKKLLSIILSLTMIVLPVKSNICSAAEDVKAGKAQVRSISKKEMFINKTKEVANEAAKFVANNSLKITAAVATLASAGWVTLNGVSNSSQIKENWSNPSLSLKEKLFKTIKILIFGVKTSKIEEQKVEKDVNVTKTEEPKVKKEVNETKK